MTISTIHLRPANPTTVAGYDLDAVAIEHDEGGHSCDFRLELGAGLGIYWAVPAGRNDRLRLFHVDGAAYHVDHPELVADPWSCDLDLCWEGALGTFSDWTELLYVSLQMSADAAWYRCEIRTYWGPRDIDWTDCLEWRRC